jgi:hypothetical protein
MGNLLDMIGRGWENFLARPNGSLSLRFYVQPTMASLLALRAGIQDARQGRQGYLWAILTRPERRLQLLHEGWRGAMTPFLLAIALDCIYQLMTVRFVYPLELLFTATLLALVPYALFRGLFNRLARLFLPAARARPFEPAHNKFIHWRKHIKKGPTKCRANLPMPAMGQTFHNAHGQNESAPTSGALPNFNRQTLTRRSWPLYPQGPS